MAFHSFIFSARNLGVILDYSLPLIPYIQALASPVHIVPNIHSESDISCPLHEHHSGLSHYYPLTKCTTASPLFSWLSLFLLSTQWQNHILALVRLHYSTAQTLHGLPAILRTKPKVPTMAHKTYLSHLISCYSILTCSYVRVFALAISSVWNVLTPQIYPTSSITFQVSAHISPYSGWE